MEGESLDLLKLFDIIQIHERVTLGVLVALTDSDEALTLRLSDARKLDL